MNKKYMFGIIKSLIPKYLLAIFIGILANLTFLAAAYLSQILIDKVLPSQDNSQLIVYLLFYLFFHVFKSGVSFTKEYLFSKYGYSILCDVRKDIFSKIISLFSFLSFTSEKQGYVITLFRDWLTSISWFLSNILLNTITDGILLLTIMVVLAIVNINIFLIVLATLPFYGLIYFFFNPKIQKSRSAMMEDDVNITQNLQEALESIKEIRTLNAEDVFNNKYAATQAKFKVHGLRYVVTTYAYDALSNIAGTLGQVIVLAFGTLSVYNGDMTIGGLIALSQLTSLLYNPVEKIVTFNRLLQTFKVEINKLTSFLEKNIEKKDIAIMPEYVGKKHTSSNVVIELDNVSFDYEELLVLKDISLSLKEGRTYAITGANGSGKSTLINIVLGLLSPKKGNVFYKGENIYQNLYNFREHVGFAPQNAFLQNDTIINNIVFGRESTTKCDIDTLLNVCEVNEFIVTNALNINSEIGEKGSKLSAGEKQKIILCRALYNNPNLLIIDEGTANMDSDSEGRIINKVRDMFPNITIVLVSHRLSTVKLSDEIIVLKESGMECIPNKDDIYSENSEFLKLFANQM